VAFGGVFSIQGGTGIQSFWQRSPAEIYPRDEGDGNVWSLPWLRYKGGTVW